MSENITSFEKASKLKLRFGSRHGDLTAEDLWDLSLPALDTLAKGVNSQLREEEEESFIPNKRKPASNNSLRLEILKHIITVKVEDQNAAKLRAEKAQTLAYLKELATAKATEQLASQSLEEIQKKIAELEAESL